MHVLIRLPTAWMGTGLLIHTYIPPVKVGCLFAILYSSSSIATIS